MNFSLRSALLFLLLLQQAAFASNSARPSIDSADLEQRIHREINRQRQSLGLPKLAIEPQLTEIARDHSLDMASNGYFSHINLQGETPADRCIRQGWNKQKQLDTQTWTYGITENIVMTHLYDKVITTFEDGEPIAKRYNWLDEDTIAQTVVKEWMNSPSHRKAMLSPRHDQEGIGVAISGDDVYVTEELF